MAGKLDGAGQLGKMWANKADLKDRILGPIGDAGIAALGAFQASGYLMSGAARYLVAGWANLKRQLVNGGKAVIVCLQKADVNEWVTLPLMTAEIVKGVDGVWFSSSGVSLRKNVPF